MNPRFFKSFLNNQEVSIAYYDRGPEQSRDVLLCVHGLARQARDFDFLAEKLSATKRVIAIDVVGRGDSSWLSDKQLYHNGTYAVLIQQFLDHLRLQKVDWLGTSMGALIAFVFNHLYPGRINKLVVSDIGPFIPQAALERIIAYVSAMPVFESVDHAIAVFKKNCASFGIADEQHWKHFVLTSIRQTEDGKYRLHYDPGISEPFRAVLSKGDVDLWPLWKGIVFPTLILRGGESDVLSQDTFTKMQQLGPHISGVVIPNVGHAPALMEDGQIDIVRKFLGY